MPGTGALILLAFAGLVVVVLLVLLQLTRLGFLVRATIPDRPRRRMFIASVSFLFTFAGVRLLVHRIVSNEGHFQWVMVHGRHIHHLVWGILILLMVGYGWLLDLGRNHTPLSIFYSRLMSAPAASASTPSSSLAACCPWAHGAHHFSAACANYGASATSWAARWPRLFAS